MYWLLMEFNYQKNIYVILILVLCKSWAWGSSTKLVDLDRIRLLDNKRRYVTFQPQIQNES